MAELRKWKRPDASAAGSKSGEAAGQHPPIAVVDMGATSIRLVVAEVTPGQPVRILEEAARGVLLGKDTFTHGRIGAATAEATLKALAGFRRIMDSYGVACYRAVATSALREAANRDGFLDRIRLRTGLDVEVIDGSEENRITYLAVREALSGHPALGAEDALQVEVGGGSAEISLLRGGEPVRSGTYALGAIRMRQSLASWHGSHERRMRLLRRHVQNIVEDIRREIPLKSAVHFIALGGDVRFAASRILGEDSPAASVRSVGREPFFSFCDQVIGDDVEDLVEKYRLHLAQAETLVPALVTYRELLMETSSQVITMPEASLRAGLLLDIVRAEEGRGVEDFSRQVLASAAALGEKYRYDARHAQNVALIAGRLFDELKSEHGLTERDRLLLQVAALLHDIGTFVGLRAHHKHSQYILSVSEIFGLSQDDMDVVSNVARYHRRATPQRSHLPYTALDRERRVDVSKMAAILRVANALDADHLQKIRNLSVLREGDVWVIEVEGAGDLTMERLASLARSDMLTEVFGHRIHFREAGPTA